MMLIIYILTFNSTFYLKKFLSKLSFVSTWQSVSRSVSQQAGQSLTQWLGHKPAAAGEVEFANISVEEEGDRAPE